MQFWLERYEQCRVWPVSLPRIATAALTPSTVRGHTVCRSHEGFSTVHASWAAGGTYPGLSCADGKFKPPLGCTAGINTTNTDCIRCSVLYENSLNFNLKFQVKLARPPGQQIANTYLVLSNLVFVLISYYIIPGVHCKSFRIKFMALTY